MSGAIGRADARRLNYRMERYQVKVQLLDRTFPIMVTQKEEESIMLGVKLLEEKLLTYRDKFHIKDDVYLALMCCLDIANELVKTEKENVQFKTAFAGKIGLLNQMLDASLETLQLPHTGP